MDRSSESYQLDFSRDSSHTLRVEMAGIWKLGNSLPSHERVLEEMQKNAGIREIRLDARHVTQWDSGLLAFLVEVNRLAENNGINVRTDDIPDGTRRLLKLAAALPEQADMGKSRTPPYCVATIGI
jgi:ABC-type transporter Mla MlaB component